MVPSNGPMYLRHGFRRSNFVPEFGASVMGIGPYALRGDEGRHAGVVVPYGGFINHPGQSSHSGALAPVGARNG